MEIKFKRDTAFRKTFFVPDSFAHPAKMDAQLLIWIVEKYTKEGETILDPMAGSGTMMLACTLGRNVILIELEKKFCKMMADNWNEVKMRPQLGSTMGNCQIIQGDARQIENILCDKIITSPPYSDMSMGGGLNTKPPREGHDDQSGRSSVSPSQEGDGGYVDGIVTSPPFSTANPRGKYRFDDGSVADMMSRSYVQGKTSNPDNIGNLPYGQIDKIVTSPPYEGSVDVPDSKQEARAERLRKAGYDPKKYQGGKGRNLQQDWNYRPVDSKITSPPYENAITGKEAGIDWSKGTRGKAEGNKPRDKSKEPAFGHLAGFGMPLGYSNSPDNIGNLKSDSYLEAMLQVYQRCYKVLKPEGLMVLVTKNFLREQQEIRLDTDTIKLCEQAGFQFIERHYRKLPSQSFWRVIYAKKYPHAPVIDKEDILVFQRV